MAETSLRVKEIRIYPIKSIRGISLPTHLAGPKGFEYDRIFMLRRKSDKHNMHVPDYTSMCLFTTALSGGSTSSPDLVEPTTLQVRFALPHTFDKPDQILLKEESVLEVPLKPDVESLEKAHVSMHSAGSEMYVMPAKYCKWFSDRFGFDVELYYIGPNIRPVLGNVNPNAPRTYVGDPDPSKTAAGLNGGWFDGLKSGIGNMLGTVATYTSIDSFQGIEEGLKFNDCAAFLVVNWESHLEAQKRTHCEIDIEKFRPNLVVEGTDGPWVEDFWGEISIGENDDTGMRITFTSNCMRCSSITVDYETGRQAKGGQGNLYKSLQKDRRVDPGNKYSPVFGRYGFLSAKNGIHPKDLRRVSVGDEVVITKMNDRRTHWYWPEL